MSHVVVIGGGITGIGVARDLAMRGIKVTVLEKGRIGCETSTHFHGMLHSGARYAVKDPYAAEKCMQENRILRDIAEEYIDFTEGVFVKLEEDSQDYYQRKMEACEKCGIPTEELGPEVIRQEYAYLSGSIDKAFKVPDGVIEPVKLLQANVKSAERQGARIIQHAEVKDIIREQGQVTGVKYMKEEEQVLEAGFVVNATGPWAEKTGEMADVKVRMSPTKGVLTVVDESEIEKVINRCRPTDSGDIIVPKGDKAIIGTTSREVDDPDGFNRDEEEERLMIEEACKISEIDQENLEYSYWGLRPLYDPGDEEKDGRDVTREFRLIDHGERDNISNFVSVVGGKWTTYRYMAEKTADKICESLGVEKRSRTAEVPLPGKEEIEQPERNWPPAEN